MSFHRDFGFSFWCPSCRPPSLTVPQHLNKKCYLCTKYEVTTEIRELRRMKVKNALKLSTQLPYDLIDLITAFEHPEDIKKENVYYRFIHSVHPLYAFLDSGIFKFEYDQCHEYVSFLEKFNTYLKSNGRKKEIFGLSSYSDIFEIKGLAIDMKDNVKCIRGIASAF